MLEPLYSAAEMRAAEEGHDESELMERAGAAVAREVLERFPDARRIAVVCGGGSNGGDGRIAARILREEGRDAVETTAVEQADVIVDALFGTGFHGEPRAEAAAAIRRINEAGAPVVSVDVPSGVDASTGEVIKAERLKGALGGYSSSPVAAEGKVWLASEEGKVSVVRAGGAWELLEVNDLGEGCYATPALSGGVIYLRTDEALYAFSSQAGS